MKKIGLCGVACMLFSLSACSDDSSQKDPVGPDNEGISSHDEQNISSSSILAESSSSIIPDTVRYDASGLTGEFTDSRDGRVYKAVKIGDQIWMAENLNYKSSSKISSCANGLEECDHLGRLYYYDDVMNAEVTGCYVETLNWGNDYGLWSPCPVPQPVQGICPDGWHLPTETEWNQLAAFVSEVPYDDSYVKSDVAGFMLKSTTGWAAGYEGSDAFGFNALPIGKGRGVSFWSGSLSEYTDWLGSDFFIIDGKKGYVKSLEVESEVAPVRCIQGKGNTEPSSSSSYEEPKSSSSIVAAYSGAYGELKDERDGNVYRTVDINGQIWMADNLKYETADGMSLCNCSDTTSCDSRGRLYPWKSAQTACPAGWHMPSQEEVEKLTAYAAQIKHDMGGSPAIPELLKDTSGWTHLPGYNVLGFSALPAGFAYLTLEGKPMDDNYCGREFDGSDELGPVDLAYYWTSTELDDGSHIYLNIEEDINGKSDLIGSTDYTHFEEEEFNHLYGMAVRCVQD